MLWFPNLQTNLHFSLVCWLNLFGVFLNCKSIKNIFIIFSLIVFTKLVAHDNRTVCRFSLASFEIFMNKRTSLKINDSRIILWIFENLINFITWRSTSHNNNICFLWPMIRMKTLFKKGINGLRLTIAQQQNMPYIATWLLVI